MKPDNRKKKRRRTCYHRARKRWIEARRALSNPAASVAMQLLGVFGFAIGRMPITAPMPMSEPYVPPLMLPRYAQRIESARRLGVPTRYLNTVLRNGRVPYPLIIEHIRLGGATRRDALTQLHKSIPAETLEWLAYIETRALWSELASCFPPFASEEDVDILLMKKTLAWVESQKKSNSPLSELPKTEYGLEPLRPGRSEAGSYEPSKPTY